MNVASLLRGLLVAGLFVVAFEAAARHFDLLDPADRPDPYQGFPGTNPLYRLERDGDAAVYRRAPNKGNYREAEFPAEKPADEFRAFCIGGSSVRSDAFLHPDGSFPHFLEFYLREALVDRVPRVVNSGGGGTGSVQNLEVLLEVLDYEPDLLIVYPEGGEKNLIPPSPQGILAKEDDASPARVLGRRLLTRLRLYHGLRDLYQALLPPKRERDDVLSAFSAFALQALIRPFDATTFTRLFELKRDRVPVLMEHVIPRAEIEHAHARFVRNLGAMAKAARARDVPIVYVLPVRNLEASFYLRFHIDPGEILPGRVDEWRDRYEQGLAAKRAGRHAEAIEHLTAVRACYVDDQDEILAFYLGECHLALGRRAEALAEFEKPYLRHPMRRLIARAAAEHGVPLVDPYPALLAETADGIPGYEAFTDAFHPMPATNRTLARAILAALPEVLAGRVGMKPLAPGGASRVQREVDFRVSQLQAPLHNRMLRAILEGREEEAISLGLAIPPAQRDALLIEQLYLGWALTRVGRMQLASQLHASMRQGFLHGGATSIPDLDTDERIVRLAFGGDLFSWF